MSGVECTRRMRELEAAQDSLKPTPIIAFTADLTDEARHDLREAGSTAFLSKPSAAGEIEGMCRALVEQEHEDLRSSSGM